MRIHQLVPEGARRLHSHQGGDSLSLTRQSPECEKTAPNLVMVSSNHAAVVGASSVSVHCAYDGLFKIGVSDFFGKKSF